MAGYATLQEAYNIDSFSRKNTSKSSNEGNKKIKKIAQQEQRIQEDFMNDYSSQDACYFNKEFGINNSVCKSENNGKPNYGNFVANEAFTTNSNDVKEYKSNTMNTQGDNCSPLQQPNYNYPISDETKAEFKKVVDIYTNYEPKKISYNEFNKNKESNDIMPYYDDDIDQYLDINTLNTSKIFTSTSGTEEISNKRYMPNYNENGYTNDNTDKYLNIKTKTDNILEAPSYNLTEEDKRNSLKSLNILKNFNSKEPINNDTKAINNYNTFFNIVLFIFIGIVIILLCDQIAELAINLGMKRAIYILEPYLNKPSNIVPSYIPEIPVKPVIPVIPVTESISNIANENALSNISISDIYKEANVK